MGKMKKHLVGARTDLALEEKESIPGSGGEVPGVELRVWDEKELNLRLTEVVIKNEEGAGKMGKPVGVYLTLEAPELAEKDEDYHREISKKLAEQLRELIKSHGIRRDVLVVGLGNADATPDSLGPRVLDHVQVTRHLLSEYGADFCEKKGYPVLSGIVPGVMAKTGMESSEIIRGIVHETKPSAVLVVDALAARSAERLAVTIQLTDTGIHPGSGVGNHRNAITEASLGIPVFAVGVPTVIQYDSMFVTPHDIDERVEMLSYTISEAIHIALFGC